MGERILREDNDYVCVISFNRPDKRNALDAKALFSLGEILAGLKKEKDIRVVVLRGAGDDVFCAGLDLTSGSDSFERTIEALEYCLGSLINYPSPIVSMVSGPAIGAGLDISVISDLRIASKKAVFGANLVKLGRIYYYTAIQRLMNLVGLAAAKEILLTGRLIDAKRAMEIGLVNRVIPSDQLVDTTYSLAKQLAEENAPLAMTSTKITIHRLVESQKMDPQVELELKTLADKVNQSEDAREGVMAMLEKRKPYFKGK